MRNIVVLCIIVFLFSCKDERTQSSTFILPQLKEVLTEYIDNNPNDSLFQLIFAEQNNKQFVTIQRSDKYYSKYFVDGCFLVNGKLVIFWELNQTWKDSVLRVSQEDCRYDLLHTFKTWEDVLSDYDRSYAPQTYEILVSGNSIKLVKARSAFNSPADDKNVINNPALNKVTNDYINDNNNPEITILRFNSIGKNDYVSLSRDYFIDRELFSGAFYRNGRLVVVYSMDKLIAKNIVDTLQLLPISNFSGYKFLHREYPRYPQRKFQIASDNSIEAVAWDNEYLMDI